MKHPQFSPRPAPSASLAAILAFALLAVHSPNEASSAELGSGLRLDGFLTLRAADTRSQPSWLDGAWGRLATSGTSANEAEADFLADVEVALDWQATPGLRLFVHGLAREEPTRFGDSAGLVQAFVEYEARLAARQTLRARAGFFFLETSRENTEALWSSPYTLTLSAWNSWIAEEFRPTGVDLRYRFGTGSLDFDLGVTAFEGCDSCGALLGWRGFALGSRRTVYGEVLPLPDVETLRPGAAFWPQRDDGTEPFQSDLDGETGYAARVRMSTLSGGVLQLTAVDNQGDRKLHVNEWAWSLEFRHLGFELPVTPGFKVLGEYAEGETGFKPRSPSFVDNHFEALYLMASWVIRQARVSVRYDRFEIRDRDLSPFGELGDEDGDGLTAAVFLDVTPWLQLGLELSDVDADRPGVMIAGGDPDLGARSVQFAARLGF